MHSCSKTGESLSYKPTDGITRAAQQGNATDTCAASHRSAMHARLIANALGGPWPAEGVRGDSSTDPAFPLPSMGAEWEAL